MLENISDHDKKVELLASNSRWLLAFWRHLKNVKRLFMKTISRRGEESSIKFGRASVNVFSPTPSTIIFEEKGHWLHGKALEMAFSNTFRWAIDEGNGLITLEHLRYGRKNPIFLFQLRSTSPFGLEAIDPHVCAADLYFGRILWSQKDIRLFWKVVGPSKNDDLDYTYILI